MSSATTLRWRIHRWTRLQVLIRVTMLPGTAPKMPIRCSSLKPRQHIQAFPIPPYDGPVGTSGSARFQISLATPTPIMPSFIISFWIQFRNPAPISQSTNECMGNLPFAIFYAQELLSPARHHLTRQPNGLRYIKPGSSILSLMCCPTMVVRCFWHNLISFKWFEYIR